jgi:hypothetical protein
MIFTFCEVHFLFLWVSDSGQWEQQYRDGFHEASVKCWLTIKEHGEIGLN